MTTSTNYIDLVTGDDRPKMGAWALALLATGYSIYSIATSWAFMPQLVPNMHPLTSRLLAILITASFWVWAFIANYAAASKQQRLIARSAMWATLVIDNGLTIGQMASGNSMVTLPAWAGEAIAWGVMLAVALSVGAIALYHQYSPSTADRIAIANARDKFNAETYRELQARLAEAAQLAAPAVIDQVLPVLIADHLRGMGIAADVAADHAQGQPVIRNVPAASDALPRSGQGASSANFTRPPAVGAARPANGNGHKASK